MLLSLDSINPETIDRSDLATLVAVLLLFVPSLHLKYGLHMCISRDRGEGWVQDLILKKADCSPDE